MKIYDKIDIKLIKQFTIFTIYNHPHFSTKTYYFNETPTILHYQKHKNNNKNLLFILFRLKVFTLFLLKLTIFTLQTYY